MAVTPSVSVLGWGEVAEAGLVALAVVEDLDELTQAALAERTGIHVTQIRRYEAGTSAPTLDVLRNIAIGLSEPPRV